MEEKNLRMCVVCRNMVNKSQLIRVVANKEGSISVDETQKAQGRGAYVCNTQECIKKCLTKKMLNRAFKRQVPDEVYEGLSKE